MDHSAPAQADQAGSTIYTPLTLAIYDILVLGFSNHLAWRCPTSELLGLYDRNLSADHLDIGPGSGWYLAKATLPTNPTIALLDLNPNSLATTARRLRHRRVQSTSHLGSVLEPFPMNRQYHSVAANFVMHCVPGTWAEKGIAFRHIADSTHADGVFFGSTILGAGVAVNLLGRLVSAVYNSRLRVFHNQDDDLEGLEGALRSAYSDVDVQVTGCVATWVARSPKRMFAGH